jgi:ribonuclease VapC
VIVDTSAVIALIQAEPAAVQVAAALEGAVKPVMPAPTAAECLIVLTARHGGAARAVFERLRAEVNMVIGEFTDEHAFAAQRAFSRYGKGRHAAGLNFGDCLSYAAAEVGRQPLLAVGNDFLLTELQFDGGVIGYWPGP